MEFLEAFKHAQIHGFTKEEFIDIWKTEMGKKLHTETAALHRASYGDFQQNHNNGYQGSDQNQHQLPLGWQQHEELKGGLHWSLEHLHSQLMEKEEQHWQQMLIKYDKMIEEFRSSFDVLSKHISNIADANASSIKLHFMQELELLKQELGRMIKQEISSSHTQSEVSAQNAEMTNIQDAIVHPKFLAFSESNHSMTGKINGNTKDAQSNHYSRSLLPHFQTLQQQTKDPLNVIPFEIQSGVQQDAYVNKQGIIFRHMKSRSESSQDATVTPYINWGITRPEILNDVGESDALELNALPGNITPVLSNSSVLQEELDNAQIKMIGNVQDSQSLLSQNDHLEQLYMNQVDTVINNNFVTEISQDTKVKSYASVVTSAASVNEHTLIELKAWPLDAFNLDTSSIVALNKGSVKATGSYAEVISHQMTDAQLSNADTAKSKLKSKNVSSVNSVNTSKLDHSNLHRLASFKQKMFTVNNCDQFSISKKSCMSPLIYSSGKRCLVRVRVYFEMGSNLNVNLHVSKGDYDDKHKWPLVLSGRGYIWNKGSDRCTEVWQLPPVSCKKPPTSKGEYVFPTVVCLSTSRGKYPNISYQKLVEKNYTEDNCLTFVWDVDAKEE